MSIGHIARTTRRNGTAGVAPGAASLHWQARPFVQASGQPVASLWRARPFAPVHGVGRRGGPAATVAPPRGQSAEPELVLGNTNDPCEEEAERVASRVVGHGGAGATAPASGGSPTGTDASARPTVPAAAGSGYVIPPVRNAILGSRGRGARLPSSVRRPMESALAADLGSVTVHTDALADDLSGSLHAEAFTSGNDIFFRQGSFDPASVAGRQLIAHELMHVAQQHAAGQQAGALVQRQWTRDGKPLTLAEVHAWYEGRAGAAVPSEWRPILEITANEPSKYPLDGFEKEPDPPAKFRAFLKRADFGIRHTVPVHDPKTDFFVDRAVPGTLSVEHKVPEQWVLGEHGTLASTPPSADFSEVAHVTYRAKSYFMAQPIVTQKSRGEFGEGFYTTTGHDAQAQRAVSEVWHEVGKAPPNDVIKLRIASAVLTKLVGTPEQVAFVKHFIEHARGYPPGLTESAAVDLMDAINAQGRILLFPDDKERRVVISVGQDGAQKMSWHEYTGTNNGTGLHWVVVGPQRPPALTGVRQIAFRGSEGWLIVNSAARRVETLSGGDPK